MADKDKNDNVEHKKKMQKEKNLEKEVVKMLIEEYGYSKNYIKTGQRISKPTIGDVPTIVDVVVFSREDPTQKTPYIVIETKNKKGYIKEQSIKEYIHCSLYDIKTEAQDCNAVRKRNEQRSATRYFLGDKEVEIITSKEARSFTK